MHQQVPPRAKTKTKSKSKTKATTAEGRRLCIALESCGLLKDQLAKGYVGGNNGKSAPVWVQTQRAKPVLH